MTWQREANDEQLVTFTNAYMPSWRLWHLHSIKFALDHLDEVSASYTSHRPGAEPGSVTESTLLGPVASGLYAAALGETVMYAEDLFTLVRGLRHPERFVAETVNFPGGKVTGLVGKLESIDVDAVSKAFFIPTGEWLELDGTELERFETGRILVRERLHEVIAWWRKYRFLQQQYKHGMTLALHPFGRELPEETLIDRRAGGAPPIYALDNEAISDETLARSGGTLAFNAGPGAALAHAEQLIKDRNFLRYALTLPTAFDDILAVARVCCELLEILIHHRQRLLPSTIGRYQVQVPNANGTWMLVSTDAVAPPLSQFAMQL